MNKISIGVALILTAFISSANGAVIAFDNPSTFAWVPDGDFTVPNHFFDPTLSASSQVAFSAGRSFEYLSGNPGGSLNITQSGVRTGASLRVVRNGAPLVVLNSVGTRFEFFLATQLFDGQSLGPGLNYQSSAAVGYEIAGARTLVLGNRPSIGFEVSLATGTHYGFVTLQASTGTLPGGMGTISMYQPIRWAYETEPNVPIVVPSPVVGLLAGALAAFAARRRRP